MSSMTDIFSNKIITFSLKFGFNWLNLDKVILRNQWLNPDSRTLVRSGLLSESEFLQFGQQSNSDNCPTNGLMSEFRNQLTCTYNFEISV